MLRTTFQNMAQQIEEALDAAACPDQSGYLLAHALTLAQDHDAGSVRAFAQGCDENNFARAMIPMLTIYAAEGAARLRGDLREVFASQSTDGVCARLSGDIEAPDAGLKRFLGMSARVVSDALIPHFRYSRLAA